MQFYYYAVYGTLTYYCRNLLVFCFGFSSTYYCCFTFFSTLGQGLETTSYPMENIFSIGVGTFGLILFALLIGNIQVSCWSLYWIHHFMSLALVESGYNLDGKGGSTCPTDYTPQKLLLLKKQWCYRTCFFFLLFCGCNLKPYCWLLELNEHCTDLSSVSHDSSWGDENKTAWLWAVDAPSLASAGT